MKTIGIFLICYLIFGAVLLKAQVYTDPVTGNVGIGTTTIDNQQGWQKVLQLHGEGSSKLLVTENSGVKVGVFANIGYNGKIGTESNHNLTFTAGYWNDVMTLTTAKNVGIGTLDPSATLDINSNNYLTANSSGTEYGTLHIRPRNDATEQFTGITFGANSGPIVTYGAQAGIYVQSSGSYGTKMYFGTTDSYANGAKKNMVIDHLGDVGIGTTDPKGYKLAVNGKIRAHEIKVETANWPDYVFHKSYQLPSLQETETHIKEKGHLPGIPSAADVKANGIDVGEMNVKLLQKIEELTLHLIEMKKELDALKSVNQNK